ncbi:YqcI/YcgG family protein [Paenibacillus hexagrammi]|uniref:YqcI/YcgG family protein n=1 Tax=Paenibacillus hexagrammi TaxID=2908839 RepID=A0ABY3SHL1_9BACL|nr:YqcI/YcgG family protein [Paenibacillus sp. YPD9-1]UJF32605.1 YqcI/YcgG family protein [Paenibacillus sp. YPD9-1]
MAVLRTKDWIEEQVSTLPEWEQNAFLEFRNMIADAEHTYPCVPGRQGFLSNNLRFGFVQDPRSDEAIEQVAQLLKMYGPESRNTGKYASLVVFFQTSKELHAQYTVEDYERLFWSVLSRITEKDPKAWPEHISQDPQHHTWEFCFDGQPYFTFCSTPAHKIRKSRHFTHFLIAFQPRWVFENMNDSTPFGRNMKKLIRHKLHDYDGIPAHPSLNWYGQEDNYEWKQYFLRDDDSVPSKCPFTFMKNKFKALGIRFHK